MKRTVIGAVVDVLTPFGLIATVDARLGEIVPLGRVADVAGRGRVDLGGVERAVALFASRPVSIFVPPNGQLAPAGSGLVLTSELVPVPLQTYDVPPR